MMKHSVTPSGYRFAALLALGLAVPASATQHIASQNTALPNIASQNTATPDAPATFGSQGAPPAVATAGESFVTLAPASPIDTGWSQRRIRFRDAALAALADPGFLQYAVAGIGLIFIAAFARRHRRRQIGWGMLPDRDGRS